MPGLYLLFLFAVAISASAADSNTLADPANRIAPDDPAWSELSAGLGAVQAVTADFVERRHFLFRRVPTELKGEVRVSAARGLSLNYPEPPAQTVIIDGKGMLVRTTAGDTSPPPDPRTTAANGALLHVLRFDLKALATDFDLFGIRASGSWTVALVPKAAGLRDTLGQITVSGTNSTVRRIEMRRSASQRIEIEIAPPRSSAAFAAEELKRYFR